MRRATTADAAAVRALSRAAYAKWVPLIGREPLPMTADYERAVVALIEVIAAADHLLIENLAVHPDHQGEGLGGRLLRHAEALARSEGLEELRLFTNAAFASNLALYARRGFEEQRREEIVPGSVAVFMRKRLAWENGVIEPPPL